MVDSIFTVILIVCLILPLHAYEVPAREHFNISMISAFCMAENPHIQ